MFRAVFLTGIHLLLFDMIHMKIRQNGISIPSGFGALNLALPYTPLLCVPIYGFANLDPAIRLPRQ